MCVLALGLSGCKSPGPAQDAREARLVVFAAASLREAFTALGDAFEREHADVELTFNFAGTQELRAQLEHGAEADVFASADQQHMDELVHAGRAVAPDVFARNEPVLVVSKEARASIRGLGDLPNAARIVIGAPEVPIGRYTLQILERSALHFGADFRARVETKVVSRELNVRQVLAKIMLGEAQAGVVYRPDVYPAPDSVSSLAIPADINVIAEYPIAVIADCAHPGLARAWLELVLSPAGQRLLHKLGFLSPSGGAAAP